MEFLGQLSIFFLLVSTLTLFQILLNLGYFLKNRKWNYESKIIVNSFRNFIFLIIICIISLLGARVLYSKYLYSYTVILNEEVQIRYIGEPEIRNIDVPEYVYSNNQISQITLAYKNGYGDFEIEPYIENLKNKGVVDIKIQDKLKYQLITFFSLKDEVSFKNAIYIYGNEENLYISILVFKESNFIFKIFGADFGWYIDYK